ncbi:MAG: histidine kinase [Parafilimonas sp.]|nr:histidine kinase [Parafilimonas sp.]
MRFIFIHIFLFFAFIAHCQEYTYTNFDIKDGLAGSTTYCTAQDKDGFLWFGTETGLSRFDGTHFVNYGIEQGLPDNEVLNIFCDSHNRLWLSMFKTDICYVLNGKVYNKYNDSIIKKIKLKGIAWQFCEDHKGNILIREDKLLHLISSDGVIKDITGFNNNSFFSAISASNDDNFFVLENNEIYELDKNGLFHSFIKVETNPSTMRLSALSKNLAIWHDNKYIFKVYSFSKKNYLTFKNPPGFINVQILDDSSFCINTINGSYIENFYTHKIDSILPKEPVSSVFKDYENNLWFTTLGEGVFKLISTEFKTLYLTRKNGNRLSIFSLIKYKGKILAGTDGFYLFLLNPKNPRNYSSFKYKYPGEVKNRIISLQQIDDTLFAGSDDNLLRVVRLKENGTIEFMNVKKLLLLNKDSLLIATKENLILVNPHTLRITDTILNERVVCMSFLNNDLYVGTLNGLVIKNLITHTETRFSNNILQTRITALEKDMYNDMWIGTYGAGVYAYKSGRLIYDFNESTGLSSNICRCISACGTNIWIGTDKGVSKIVIGQKPYIETKFTHGDGLPSNMINAILQDSNRLFVGTPSGLTYFNSDKVIATSKCILHVTNIISGLDTLDNTNIKLQPNNNSIRFEYIAISYSSNHDTKYYYRINGLNNGWTVTTNTSVNYPSLPPGNFSFEIKAVNKYNVWSKTVTIPFEIEKKIWQQFWFRLIAFISFSLLAWYIISSRIKEVKRKENEKNNTIKQIAELKQKALKSQISPHFIFNCLNSIQQYIVEKNVEDSNIFISRFSELIRKTLDYSEKNEITIKEELNYLKTYLLLEQERFENNFQFEIKVSLQNEIENNYIPPLILQPLVENAIKHGIRSRNDNNGTIEITVEFKSAYVSLTVKDNGQGIFHTLKSKTALFSDYQSMGIQLVQERINALKDISGEEAKITIQEVDDKNFYHGTIINIEIPLL